MSSRAAVFSKAAVALHHWSCMLSRLYCGCEAVSLPLICTAELLCCQVTGYGFGYTMHLDCGRLIAEGGRRWCKLNVE